MRTMCLLLLCFACLSVSCSSGGETAGLDVEAEDNFQADGNGDAAFGDLDEEDLVKPECTVDSDCTNLDDSQCRVATCDDGTCLLVDAADGTTCDDDNGCTQTDTCRSGVCRGDEPVTCPVPDQCHDTGVCDPATGECSNPAEADGTPCDDGNEATGGDSCQGGLCLGDGCVCNTFGPCCDGCFGVNEGGACSDGDACTQTDVCDGGFCVGSDPVLCEALDQCHEVGTCEPANGDCSNPPKADTTPCDDENERTTSDQCTGGVCAGTPCVCNTNDTCCDGCLAQNLGDKCWEGTQHGGLCNAEGLCHDQSRWVVVALNTIGIGTIDTDNQVAYGPFLDGWLGTDGGGRFDVAVSPDGTTAVVSNFGDSTLHFVDLSDPTDPVPLGTVVMPMFAEDVAYTPDGKFVLVTDGGFSKYIVVVDTASRTIVEAFSHEGLFSNAVAVAKDGTVLVADYFTGSVHGLTIDAQGHLTYVGGHTVFVDWYGDVTVGKGKRTLRPVNVFISPDGKTVLVPDTTKYNETPTMMDPLIDAGYAFYSLVVFEIVSPGVIELKGNIKKVPAVAQSLAFSDDGRHAYALGNNMLFRSLPDGDTVFVDDHILVFDISETGEVTLDTSVMPSLKRNSTSQLFGVDGIVVSRGKAYATHATLSGATKNVSVVDLSTFAVSRLPVGDYAAGIAVIPMNAFDAPFVPGPATCEDMCGGMNWAGQCGCDVACSVWNDCCVDVDIQCQGCDPEECEEKDYTRVCEMLPNGTYGCGCIWGYVYDVAAGCVDINECDLGINNCLEGTTCLNTEGSYWCVCPEGMSWDSFGSCFCPSGFVGDMESGCVDIDECADGTGPCKEGANCVNLKGSYECECDSPLYPDGDDGCACQPGLALDETGDCVDVDECADGTGPCKNGATCVNQDGYYECLCPPGFVSDGWDGCECPWGYVPDEVGGCAEIDECANDPCDDTATCVDQVGYYECQCEPPMLADGWYACYCPAGYVAGEAGGCVEVDECETEPCDESAKCVDYVGYRECVCDWPKESNGWGGCQCAWGYVADENGECLDRDECDEGDYYCPDGYECVNIPGYYDCW